MTNFGIASLPAATCRADRYLVCVAKLGIVAKNGIVNVDFNLDLDVDLDVDLVDNSRLYQLRTKAFD